MKHDITSSKVTALPLLFCITVTVESSTKPQIECETVPNLQQSDTFYFCVKLSLTCSRAILFTYVDKRYSFVVLMLHGVYNLILYFMQISLIIR
jgi:hypothetical protein